MNARLRKLRMLQLVGLQVKELARGYPDMEAIRKKAASIDKELVELSRKYGIGLFKEYYKEQIEVLKKRKLNIIRCAVATLGISIIGILLGVIEMVFGVLPIIILILFFRMTEKKLKYCQGIFSELKK
jgi:hypothetical protein